MGGASRPPMIMAKATYDKRNKSEYTFHPRKAFALEWDKDHGCSYSVCMSEFEIAVVLKMVMTFLEYHWIWGFPSPRSNWTVSQRSEWQKIVDWINNFASDLIMASHCDNSVQRALMKILIAAITDRQIHPDSHYLHLDPQNSVTPSNPNPPATEIDRSAFISNGNLVDWGVADAIGEVLSKGFIDLPNGVTTVQDDIQGMNDRLDTANDHLDTLHKRFFLNNWIIPDQNIAQILNNTLRVEGDFEDILQSVGKQWGIASVLKAVFTVPDSNLTETWWQSAKSAWDTVFGQPQREFGIAFVLNEVIKRATIGKTQTGDQPYLDQVAKRLSDDDHRNLYDAINDLELTSNGTDTSGIESQLMALVNALESMERAGTRDTETIGNALDRVHSAIEAMEIVQINAHKTAKVFYKSSCGCGDTDVQSLIDGSGSNNGAGTGGQLAYQPVIIKDGQGNITDCVPLATNAFLEFLDAFLGATDYLRAVVGDTVAAYLAPSVLIMIATTSTALAGALAALNLITLPDPSDVATVGVTVLGVYITYLLLQLFADFSIEGLQLLLDYVRYDYDFWKAWECSEVDIDVNLIPQRGYDYGKSIGKSDAVSTAVKKVLQQIVNSDLKKVFERGKALVL